MQRTTTGPIEAILTEYRHVRETPALETADADASDRRDGTINVRQYALGSIAGEGEILRSHAINHCRF